MIGNRLANGCFLFEGYVSAFKPAGRTAFIAGVFCVEGRAWVWQSASMP